MKAELKDQIGKPLFKSQYQKFQQNHPGISKRDDISIQHDLEDKELSTFYNSSDVFVFPSVDEGFGIPLLEAMYTKTPSVVVDTPTTREICGDAALYVNQGDVKSLVDGILLIYTQPKIRNALIEKQRLRIDNYLVENRDTDQTRLFRSMIGSF